MHRVDRVVRVGLDLHVVQEGRVDHPLELLVPEKKKLHKTFKLINESNYWNFPTGAALKENDYTPIFSSTSCLA